MKKKCQQSHTAGRLPTTVERDTLHQQSKLEMILTTQQNMEQTQNHNKTMSVTANNKPKTTERPQPKPLKVFILNNWPNLRFSFKNLLLLKIML